MWKISTNYNFYSRIPDFFSLREQVMSRLDVFTFISTAQSLLTSIQTQTNTTTVTLQHATISYLFVNFCFRWDPLTKKTQKGCTDSVYFEIEQIQCFSIVTVDTLATELHRYEKLSEQRFILFCSFSSAFSLETCYMQNLALIFHLKRFCSPLAC